MIATLLSDLWPYLAGLIALVGGFFMAKQAGKTAERNKRTADRLKAMQEKSKIEKDVSNADRDSVIDANTRP